MEEIVSQVFIEGPSEAFKRWFLASSVGLSAEGGALV